MKDTSRLIMVLIAATTALLALFMGNNPFEGLEEMAEEDRPQAVETPAPGPAPQVGPAKASEGEALPRLSLNFIPIIF